MVGHSLRHPSVTSRTVRPPVMTTLPEKKHSSTTGDACGRKMSPGNMFFWYVQCRFSRVYLRACSFSSSLAVPGQFPGSSLAVPW